MEIETVIMPDWHEYFDNEEQINNFLSIKCKGQGWYQKANDVLLITEIPEITLGKLKGSKYKVFCWNDSTKNKIIKSYIDTVSSFLSFEDKD